MRGKKRYRSPSNDYEDDYDFDEYGGDYTDYGFEDYEEFEDYSNFDRYDRDCEDYDCYYEEDYGAYGDIEGDSDDGGLDRRRRWAKGKSLPRRSRGSRRVPDWKPEKTGVTSDEAEAKDDYDRLQEKLSGLSTLCLSLVPLILICLALDLMLI